MPPIVNLGCHLASQFATFHTETCWLAGWLEEERGEPMGAGGNRPLNCKPGGWNQSPSWNNLRTHTVTIIQLAKLTCSPSHKSTTAGSTERGREKSTIHEQNQNHIQQKVRKCSNNLKIVTTLDCSLSSVD